MKVLFLTLQDFESIDENNIYTDLLRKFWENGHELYVISPVEKRTGKKTYILNTEKAVILKPQIYNMQKTGSIEKAFSMFTIEGILTNAIRKYFSDVKFDIILYSTPPISFYKPVTYAKNRDAAKSYLLQKDIVPEAWIDLGVLKKTGIKGIIYRYYRSKEVKLLKVSDHIGCMSQANIDYLKIHNAFLDPTKVELCPNSIEPIDKSVDEETRIAIREKYGIPQDKTVFVYGGNLGKPQGIPFLIECLRKCEGIEDAYYLIVGDGTEYHLISDFVETEKPKNVKLMRRLPKEDYDTMVGACDVGLIFLDHRFTIPNFPSRLLSYMQAKLPVLACTDPNTDIGKVIVDGGFGWWCESDNAVSFKIIISNIEKDDLTEMGLNAYNFLKQHYDVKYSYKTIINTVEG